jgi:pimeloyl-ACP methyl ester carboxylesterase
MIVQTVAIEASARVRSLVSIMSTTGSRRVGHPSYRTLGLLLGKPPREREAAIDRVVKTFKVIGSPGFPFDEERVRDIAGRSFDRGHSEAGVTRQLHAITASGDRTAALRKLEIPTLVIHGTSDRLVNPSGGRATAAAIPGARLRMIEGMGHDLPRELWPTFVEEIAANAARASGGTDDAASEGTAATQPA